MTENIEWDIDANLPLYTRDYMLMVGSVPDKITSRELHDHLRLETLYHAIEKAKAADEKPDPEWEDEMYDLKALYGLDKLWKPEVLDPDTHDLDPRQM